MVRLRRTGLGNPAFWYFGAGLVLIALSLWAPYATARRTTRVEQRADGIARLLLEAIHDWPFALTPDDALVALARFHQHAACERIYVTDLEIVEPPLPGTLLVLQNKHYVFHLAESPPDRRETPSPGALPNYEVMAWPRNATGPAHSVYFHPDNALPAYTRNLAQGYRGLEPKHRPKPGCAHRRQALWEWTTSYYGQDDGRWIAFPSGVE
ncbi:MAG: hypothetical protein NXI31_18540 [bacterium]|nr:hypothetical protein [bacterium]